MRRISVFVLVVFISLFTAASFAQIATTSLRGVVKDPTGASVPGATVTLSNGATGASLKTTSKSGGDYELLQIPPATYVITVTAPGFGSTSKQAELLVNQPATIDFSLAVKGTTEVVEVTEATQTLNTIDASLGGSTNNATIQALPSEERNVPDLLSLQPGVFFLPPPTNPAMADSRTGAVNGGRSDQGNITLDGVDDNDQVRGLAFTGVLRETQDSVEEFRVTTSNADADAGRSSGAQVSLITKSGTNHFHGSAYEYFRPSDTVSNNYFNKQAQLESGEDNRPPKLIRNIFGGEVGGPIIKDKLFFFANYEGERIAESAIVSQTAPTALYQQGVIQYIGDNSSGGTETDTITPAQVAMLDAGCQACGTAAYPNPPGVNPNSLALFNSVPAANGTSLGDGLNEGSYTFSSPNPRTLNTSIVRLDYTPTPSQHIFGRGGLQKDTTGFTEQYPGQGPSSTLEDNSKGMIFGWTWSIGENMVNDLRYGYIRQGYGNAGVGTGDYVDFRFLSNPTAETRTTVISVPVNNIIDNFSLTKGKHNMQFGANWRRVDQNRTSDANSFNNASTNPYWLKGNPPQPDSLPGLGLNPVDGGFGNSYQIAYANLIGTVPSVTVVSNYQITSPTSATLLADGTPLARRFKANEYEGYAQDTWHILPNLTITYGVRYTYLQTPYETKGQEVTPTVDTHAWYTQRETAALQGQIYEPNLTFAPAGKFYNKPGFYPANKNNFAPRFAIVYSSDPKTTWRAGAGMYYDHFGQGLINTFDQNGSFGISSAVTNQAGVITYDAAARFTGRHNIPTGVNDLVSPPTETFPFTAPTGAEGFAITWGIDNKLKTPYTEAFDLSMQHEFPAGFTFELAYVGRLGNHLLQALDLAEPVDFTDPQGGGDYYTAGSTLSKEVDEHGGDPTATVQPIPYFENVFPFMANVDYPGESATQAIYSDEWAPYRYNYGATTSLADIDFYCVYGCPDGYQSKFWQNQFSSLYALSTIGKSYYNAAQFTLRHPKSHGFQMEVNYTFSKSIDWGSDAERSTEFSIPAGVAAGNSSIINTWKPYLNKAVSDFDTTNLVTATWVYQLPFGKGKKFLGTANPFVQAVVAGWQSGGIFRYSSGLPFSLFEPGWTTDWQQEGYGINTDPTLRAKKHFDSSGNVLYFQNANAINGGVYNGSPVRLPYPGETGERNRFRGDGYLDLDANVNKTWGLGRYGNLQFAWEVYNVTNSNRFDPFTIGSQLTGGNLGVASALLTVPRRMQFSLRYAF
ncbi:MAG TPA: TonB-dependent receptor [Acidobacteriaceae bacterium]|nr:TonB-dependent receptor [Acidobacteriaceae bacterium]